jgi:hypothetical protein
MNSLNTFQRRIRDEIAALGKEIQSHNQQLAVLTKRREGLNRAAELFDSERAAIAELLQASIGNGTGIAPEIATVPSSARQRSAANPKITRILQKQAGHATRTGPSKTKTGSVARGATQDGALTRVDMIAAVLRRHPRRTVRELIALLDKEFHWKTNESAVTGKLYTRRDKFVHTQPDRSSDSPGQLVVEVAGHSTPAVAHTNSRHFTAPARELRES